MRLEYPRSGLLPLGFSHAEETLPNRSLREQLSFRYGRIPGGGSLHDLPFPEAVEGGIAEEKRYVAAEFCVRSLL